jgi:hypothetical protein
VFLLTEAGWDAGGSPQIPLAFIFSSISGPLFFLIGIDIFSGPLLIEKLILSYPSID